MGAKNFNERHGTLVAELMPKQKSPRLGLSAIRRLWAGRRSKLTRITVEMIEFLKQPVLF